MTFETRPSPDQDDRARITAVIFSAPERRLSAMDVAAGPCVPLPGRKTSVASVHAQEGYETPTITSALYRVLTGLNDAGLLTLLSEEGEGRLFRFADRFVAAIANGGEPTPGHAYPRQPAAGWRGGQDSFRDAAQTLGRSGDE